MRTIGRHYAGPPRNWAEDCDVCGVRWHRSDLTVRTDGLLVCPDDRDGRCALELDEANSSGDAPTVTAKTRTV